MRRAYIDENGYLQSVLDVPKEDAALRTDLVEELPPPAQPGHFVRRVQGQWVQELTSVRAQAQLEAEPLEDVQRRATQAVDEAAERARLKYISAGAGQALEYEAAQREADIFLRNGVGGRPEYPMLQADVDAGVAVDLQAAAQRVAAARDGWEAAGAGIRRERLRAKRLIAEASTRHEALSARDAGLAALAQL